ncbi:ribosomal-protein-alanine N-acetyltransferase [Microvirgula aerodenitrificans]|uniref:[Ribosomal protein bS18]-alanine N-acetyltransferase n=1 Tax=Microvirgula aerodenitrificans TaxID=57480 RepID=A0A2S0P7F0_9NEIS|nr:ribosomal protein S18-alanine N-acetyltransferase [Microvirgula aerodenitrificans]AVY93265.1 ribosomal-protein-alanine N-acetyltransferase [Microvirgula aerodenitrificans]
MNPQFRPATDADTERLATIAAGARDGAWTRGQIAGSLHGGSQVLVAQIDADIVGFAVLQTVLDDAELHDIVIARDWQRRGLGRQLLDTVLAAARTAGATRLLLEVRAGNGAALALYTARGFVRCGVRRDYYRTDNGREDAILMEIAL